MKKIIGKLGLLCVAVFIFFPLSSCSNVYRTRTTEEEIESMEQAMEITVDHAENPVEIVYFRNVRSGPSSDGGEYGIFRYPQSIAEELGDSRYWLPLPMPEKAEYLLYANYEGKYEFEYCEDLTPVPQPPHEVNGYWFYCNLEPFKRGAAKIYLCDIDNIENYKYFSTRFIIAWYDVGLNQICYYEWDS